MGIETPRSCHDVRGGKVVTYALNNDLLPLLRNGKVAFTIDQQPYLQGYLSIDSLWLYKKNKSVIGARQSIPTARSSSTRTTSATSSMA